MCSKFVNHSKPFNELEILHIEMNKVFLWAAKTIGEMATGMMWNWQSSCANCVFNIVQEVGAELRVSIWGMLTLVASLWVCRNLCYPMEELLKGRKRIYCRLTKTHLFWLQKHLKLKSLCRTSQGRHTEPSLELPLFPLPPTLFSLSSQLTNPAQITHQIWTN